jgi:hypothetical protein
VLAPILSFAQTYLPPDYYANDGYRANIGFWQNLGQIIDSNGDPRPDIAFYSEGGLPRMYMQNDSRMSFVLASIDLDTATADTLRRLDVSFTGETMQLRDPVVFEQKPYHQSFYLPHCGPLGVTSVTGYSRVVYEAVWTNTDVHYYSGGQGQKMAFVIRPGGNPANIQLLFQGQDSLKIDIQGALRIWSGNGFVRLEEAVAYQVGAGNTIIPVGWTAQYIANNGTGIVGFSFAAYDPTLPLVLQIGPAPLAGGGNDEPGMCWSTYIGGDGNEVINESCQDASASYYVIGNTSSQFSAFPAAPGFTYLPGQSTMFSIKFNSQDQIVWKTFFGAGSGSLTYGTGIGVKTGNELYMAGFTNGITMLHFQPGSAFYQPTVTSATNKGFIGRFSKATGERQWSSYFGEENLTIQGLSIANDKRVYIVGSSEGSMPPVDDILSTGTVLSHGVGRDGFAAMFNDQDRLNWRTFLPGSGLDEAFDIDIVDTKVVVVGITDSPDMFVSSLGSPAYEQVQIGGQDCFLVEYDLDCDRQWGTYLGSIGSDAVGLNAVSIDPLTKDIAIAGRTSTFLTVVPGVGWYQSTNSPFVLPGFIARFGHTDRSLTWHTMVHGTSNSATDLQSTCFDQQGNLFVAGRFRGTGFPHQALSGIYDQPSINDDLLNGGSPEASDMVVMSFTPSQYLAWNTYFGGFANSLVHEYINTMLRREYNGNLYAAGYTSKDLVPTSYFPLDDGYGVPYFEDTWQGGNQEGCIAAFCASALTGLSEVHAIAFTLHATCVGNELTIWGLPAEPGKYIIFDALGHQIQSGRTNPLPGAAIRLSLTPLANGVYVFQSAENSVRFVVQHQ